MTDRRSHSPRRSLYADVAGVLGEATSRSRRRATHGSACSPFPPSDTPAPITSKGERLRALPAVRAGGSRTRASPAGATAAQGALGAGLGGPGGTPGRQCGRVVRGHRRRRPARSAWSAAGCSRPSRSFRWSRSSSGWTATRPSRRHCWRSPSPGVRGWRPSAPW